MVWHHGADGAAVATPGPDDHLRRSPTGRVPQWVIDEAAGLPSAPSSWRSAPTGTPPVRRRRRLSFATTAAVVLALGAGAWAWAGMPGLPAQAFGQLPALPGVGARTAEPPSATVVALADAAYLSPAGRDIFFATSPVVLDAEHFAGRCDEADSGLATSGGGAVGCYQGATNAIVVYGPPDARLYAFVVETAAHELLHAAWARLTAGEQAAATPLLEAEVAGLPVDDPIHAAVAASVGDEPGNRATELFAYVGTQVWRDGGAAPDLEALYARFITDRRSLVAVHTGWVGMLDSMEASIEQAGAALGATRTANAADRAQYDADAAAVEYYRGAYQAKVDEVAALPASQAARLQLSWVWWDGTNLPMAPAADTLATAAQLLARDDAALLTRVADLDARDTAANAEQVRVEALVTDLQALQAQLTPAGS